MNVLFPFCRLDSRSRLRKPSPWQASPGMTEFGRDESRPYIKIGQTRRSAPTEIQTGPGPKSAAVTKEERLSARFEVREGQYKRCPSQKTRADTWVRSTNLISGAA
jgi:hypothetical protein